MKKLYIPTLIFILIVEGLYIGLRWFNTGHPPMFGTFEATLSASWTLVLFSIILDRKARFARFLIPFAGLTFLYGLNFDTTEKPLVISEDSLLIWFHALFAWIAYGFYAFSFSGAAMMISQELGTDFKSVPNSIDAFTYKTLLYGFLAQTIMFILGSYYSILLHGSWWVWDPVEYLFLVSWLVYAIPLHGRIFYSWGQKTFAWLIILGMLMTILLYWGLAYFPFSTYHIFDTELKSHF